ncbi:MAG: molecular chaperone HtpG [Epulopiscium sp.]|nr:molecular chaperone HtpG [Candidatus Epulonipiscium sp.]
MMHESGSLSIHSENIFPIIKKWLYSDQDIFIRELVSNASDAIMKLKKLETMGEAQIPQDTEFKIQVVVDDQKKIIQVIDNGIGMTAEEVKQYINQIAFSGAEDFLEKYKDKTDQDQIIGHFGLGFYSAFMVADQVQIDTLSYQEGAEPVKWICDGGTEYKMEKSNRKERGTTITLYISEEGQNFLNEYTLRSTLQKYCSFMPVEIYFENPNQPPTTKEPNSDIEKDEKKPEPINNPSPLYLKHPNDCTDEEYKAFYREVFFDFQDPLFWIHLNMDYPFKMKGILYFPKLKNEFETMEGQIKLYCNQVFVADNIKEVIPEFLLLLKGVMDCPDFPLNVSRSFLQNDGYVNKISNYITKKVADKLKSLYKKEKENYEKYWDDIHPFIKYGCLRDEKFYERMNPFVLYKTTKGDYVTLDEYLERNKEKHDKTVFYVTNEQQQAQYIHFFKENDLEAVILPSTIDQPFISHIEMKKSEVSFKRVDSDLSDVMKTEDDSKSSDETKKSIEEMFRKALGKEDLKIQIENLKSENISAMILLSEQSRRMQDMSYMFGNFSPGMFPEEQTLVINQRNPLVQRLFQLQKQATQEEDVKMICEHLYDLALLSHKPLDAQSMNRFIQRNQTILARLLG